jgi:hypothetical protein
VAGNSCSAQSIPATSELHCDSCTYELQVLGRVVSEISQLRLGCRLAAEKNDLTIRFAICPCYNYELHMVATWLRRENWVNSHSTRNWSYPFTNYFIIYFELSSCHIWMWCIVLLRRSILMFSYLRILLQPWFTKLCVIKITYVLCVSHWINIQKKFKLKYSFLQFDFRSWTSTWSSELRSEKVPNVLITSMENMN